MKIKTLIPLQVQFKKKQSFFKQHKVYPMFPYHEEKLRWDEYGEIIKHEHFNVDDVSERKHPLCCVIYVMSVAVSTCYLLVDY